MSVRDRITTGRTEEEYFKILRDRVIECVCREIKSANEVTFHGVDMIRKVVYIRTLFFDTVQSYLIKERIPAKPTPVLLVLHF